MKRPGKEDIYVGRRYGDFAKLHKQMRTELPGKVLPPLPRKNKSSTASNVLGIGGDDDASSVSSRSTQATGVGTPVPDDAGSYRSMLGIGHARSPSVQSNRSQRSSGEFLREKPREKPIVLYREDQRVSLRAFLRTFLQNETIAQSKATEEFLTSKPVKLNEEEFDDIRRRKGMDEKRIEEQERFYEVARQRARELDVYMEKFRRDLVERSTPKRVRREIGRANTRADGLTKLFAEIKEKPKIVNLTVEYQKFAEWLRIESVCESELIIDANHNTGSLQQSTIFSWQKRILRKYSPRRSEFTPWFHM